MLGDVNKLFVFKRLLTMPSNVLPLHLKQTFPPIIWIFTEGDGIESRLHFKIFTTLHGRNSIYPPNVKTLCPIVLKVCLWLVPWSLINLFCTAWMLNLVINPLMRELGQWRKLMRLSYKLLIHLSVDLLQKLWEYPASISGLLF